MQDHDFSPFFGMPYGLGWVITMLFWVLIIAGSIAIVRWLSEGATTREEGLPSTLRRTPSDILRERYARGEIDRKEFMQRLEDLNGR